MKWAAAQWIERRMDDEAFDEAAFDAWLASDPGHGPVFDTMWRRTMGPDMDAALNSYKRQGASRRTVLASVVAALLVTAGGYKAMPLIELRLAKPQEYAVAHGNVREIMLADGTQLTLAGGADIKVRYTRHDRVVELTRGAIFANVSHDAQRPFRIRTGSARIEVVGTSFEVSSKPTSIRVAVASGVVQFGGDGWFDRPIDLNMKQAAILDRTGLKRIADVNPENVARWRSEWVEYKGAPLRQVIADLQSLSSMPIEIADAGLGDKLVSGRIRLTEPMSQVENLSITHGFRVRRTDSALIISNN